MINQMSFKLCLRIKQTRNQTNKGERIMEDLVETMSRIESLKTLAAKKTGAVKKKATSKSRDDRFLGVSLMDAMGALDFGSSFTEDKAFFDIDSALAARQGGANLEDYLLDDDAFLGDDEF